MSTLIEAMAKAMYDASKPFKDFKWETTEWQDYYRHHARTSLKAQAQWLVNEYAPNQGESMDPAIVRLIGSINAAIGEAAP